MRIAIFSDIHANKELLVTALDELKREDIQYLVSLGDIVGYGNSPNECCEVLQAFSVVSVAGNHDLAAVAKIEPFYFSKKARKNILWTRTVISNPNFAFLQSLPLHKILFGEILLVHGALSKFDKYLTSEVKILEEYHYIKKMYPRVRICFYGHTHNCRVHSIKNNKLYVEDSAGIKKLRDNDFYFVNPGSLGYSQKYTAIPTYCIYDLERREVFIKSLSSSPNPSYFCSFDPPFSAALAKQYGLYYCRLLKKAINKIRTG